MKKLLPLIVLIFLGLVSCTVFRGEESVSQYADNTSLTARTKTALIQDDRVSATKIHVESIKGNTVVLSGIVKHAYQKEAAHEIASKVKGVRKVINKIAVIAR